jgi:hypothetical protein
MDLGIVIEYFAGLFVISVILLVPATLMYCTVSALARLVRPLERERLPRAIVRR